PDTRSSASAPLRRAVARHRRSTRREPTGDGGAVGQHRKLSRRRRWPLVALGAAVVVAAGAGVVVYRSTSAPACEPVPVVVAVDPSVQEPVTRLLAAERDADPD